MQRTFLTQAPWHVPFQGCDGHPLSGVLGLICEVELLVKGPVLSHPPIHPSVLSGPVPHASRVLSVGDPVSVSTPVLTL